MRAVGSTVLKVDAAATVVSEPNNQVSYSFAAADVDTAGDFLGWWRVTIAGQDEDTPEFLVRILEHSGQTHTYLEVEQAKSTLELSGTSHSDADLEAALVAASRAVDEITGTRFFTTTGTEIRYYTPDNPRLLQTDDINTITELATDESGGTGFSSVWTANDEYVLEPLNASLDGRPWNRIRVAGRSFRLFTEYPRSVRVTGKFGWTAAPDGVQIATGIIATKIMRRAREAPFGIVTVGLDGSPVRIARSDGQVMELLAPYNRDVPFA
jgi:hypothetical protein